MNKEFEEHGIPASDEQPHRRNVHGEALQMNDNGAGGIKPVSRQPPDAAEPHPDKGQGRALRVKENSAGE